MSERAISVKVLGQLKNSHVQFTIGQAEDYYVITAGQAGLRITLNTDQQNMITFLEGALERVRRGQTN